MKRRYLAVLMGIMVATTSVPAMVYAEDSKTETAADAANDESGEAAASDENGDESRRMWYLVRLSRFLIRDYHCGWTPERDGSAWWRWPEWWSTGWKWPGW